MQFRILFHSLEFESFDWVKLDSPNGLLVDQGEAKLDQLRNLIVGATSILCFLPQQVINLTSVSFSSKPSKQQINAIDYAIEDQLAEDIEDCFFAVGEIQQDNSIPLAVIQDSILKRCTEALKSQMVNVHGIYPQSYLCPWHEHTALLATITRSGEGFLIRDGRHGGFYCQASVLGQVIDLLRKGRKEEQNQLEVYSSDKPAELEQADVEIIHKGSINLLAQALNVGACINLKQKQYQTKNLWMEQARKWRWPSMVAAVLLVTVVSSHVLDLLQQRSQLDDLIMQQRQVLEQARPGLEISDNPKQQMIQLLMNDSDNDANTGFLDLLHEYTQLKTGFNNIRTSRIQYQSNKLVINLESPDINSLESFKSKIEQSRTPAVIDNVNISPTLTSGRLTLGGEV